MTAETRIYVFFRRPEFVAPGYGFFRNCKSLLKSNGEIA